MSEDTRYQQGYVIAVREWGEPQEVKDFYLHIDPGQPLKVYQDPVAAEAVAISAFLPKKVREVRIVPLFFNPSSREPVFTLTRQFPPPQKTEKK